MSIKLKIIPALALLCLISTGLAAQKTATQKLVSDYSRKEPLRSGIFGVLAMRGADTLAQHNRQLKMVPASNVKLITTGLALTRLGADWRFRTTLAYSGEIKDGVLEGDLYIVGGGDPTTGSASSCADSLSVTFARWKSLLDLGGISKINGRIIGDQRFFQRPSQGMSWQAEDFGYNYGAGPSGLNFFENSQSFLVTPAGLGETPTIEPLFPDTPWMSYSNFAVTSTPGSGNTLYYLNTDFGPYGEFRGHFPPDRKPYTLECSNPFGAYTCAYFFHNYLMCNGILVSKGYADIGPDGNVRSDLLFSDIGSQAAARNSLVSLGEDYSPVLWKIVRDTNVESDNFFAEAMFNMLSENLYGHSCRDSSAIAEKELLIRMGLNPGNSCSLIDGSGLSRKDYVSPEFFVRFLRKMYSGPVREYYIGSLPSPGGKGTLKYRMESAPQEIKARVKMKSGSMHGVLCFSGYILPAEKTAQPIIFSILTNNVSGPSRTVAAIIDEIILSLAQEP